MAVGTLKMDLRAAAVVEEVEGRREEEAELD